MIPKPQPSEPSQPRFFWQGVLILLPVAVLVVVGWIALRQDKRLVEAEARQRAQDIAEEVADKIWNEATAPTAAESGPSLSFRVDSTGRLVFPPPVSEWPVPEPFDFSELTPGQLQLWQDAQLVSLGPTNSAARELWQKFIESQPPERFLAAARF
ncbi:MAG: hypothetical protein HZA90_12640, partial [Verrucomicrobia bacterium]|nr:hypothetical protein [Verrucomicrobiota bacterium]